MVLTQQAEKIVWAELKKLINEIYATIKQNNFVCFLKENELRKFIKNNNHIYLKEA